MSESRGGEKRSRQRRGEEKGGVRGVIIMGEGGGYGRLEKVGNKGGRGQVVKKRRDVEWEKKMRVLGGGGEEGRRVKGRKGGCRVGEERGCRVGKREGFQVRSEGEKDRASSWGRKTCVDREIKFE